MSLSRWSSSLWIRLWVDVLCGNSRYAVNPAHGATGTAWQRVSIRWNRPFRHRCMGSVRAIKPALAEESARRRVDCKMCKCNKRIDRLIYRATFVHVVALLRCLTWRRCKLYVYWHHHRRCQYKLTAPGKHSALRFYLLHLRCRWVFHGTKWIS